jgi:hypothetical protein
MHDTVLEIDVVHDISHLNEPGEPEMSASMIVFQSPPRNEPAYPSD